jgi:hypothetical protein
MNITREEALRIAKGEIDLLNSLIERIKDEAVEKALKLLPSVMGHLMTQHIALTRLGENLLKDNPEFKEKRDIVQRTLEEFEANNPGVPIEEVLQKAIPSIREKIKITSQLDVTRVEKPQLPLSFHGEL